MKKQFAVFGLGSFGRSVALTLENLGCDVVVVDKSYEKIQEIAEHIERELRMRGEAEIRSEVIGEAVMNHLEKTDQIAYVRFASVYRQFADVNNFMQELQRIMKNNESVDRSDKE